METEGRKKLPVGTANFELIRQNNGYYVDKTNLVPKLLDKVFAGSTVLFTVSVKYKPSGGLGPDMR